MKRVLDKIKMQSETGDTMSNIVCIIRKMRKKMSREPVSYNKIHIFKVAAHEKYERMMRQI